MKFFNLLVFIFIFNMSDGIAYTFDDVRFIEGVCKNGEFIPKDSNDEIVYKRLRVNHEYCDSNTYYRTDNRHYNYYDYDDRHYRIAEAFNRGHFESCPYCRTVEFVYNRGYENHHLYNHNNHRHYYIPIYRDRGHFESRRPYGEVEFVY